MAPPRNSASDAAPNVENGGMATHLVQFSLILADFGCLALPGGGGSTREAVFCKKSNLDLDNGRPILEFPTGSGVRKTLLFRLLKRRAHQLAPEVNT